MLTNDDVLALMTDEPCPKCGHRLQRLPGAPGCWCSSDCTHACPNCGWHFAPTTPA